MAKTDKLLAAFKANIGKWTCGYCNSGSNQPAATFRELKKLGYSFEEVSPNRWAKNMYCSTCETKRSHYKLLKPDPFHIAKPRISINGKTRKRVISLLRNTDAFTGATISSTPEIDHKIPWSRLDQDIDGNVMNDNQIRKHFQLLTREHNLLKDRACMRCIRTNLRPPFFEIEFWYSGDEKFNGSCEGCGWYDGEKWRKELNDLL